MDICLFYWKWSNKTNESTVHCPTFLRTGTCGVGYFLKMYVCSIMICQISRLLVDYGALSQTRHCCSPSIMFCNTKRMSAQTDDSTTDSGEADQKCIHCTCNNASRPPYFLTRCRIRRGSLRMPYSSRPLRGRMSQNRGFIVWISSDNKIR